MRSQHQLPNRCHRIFSDLSLVRNQATACDSQGKAGRAQVVLLLWTFTSTLISLFPPPKMSDPFGGEEPATMNGGDMFQVSLRHVQPAEALLTNHHQVSEEQKNQQHISDLRKPKINLSFVCLYSTRSPMGQQTTMQLLPRWTFRGKNLRVYGSGGRSRRRASKLWVSRKWLRVERIEPRANQYFIARAWQFPLPIARSFLCLSDNALFSLPDKTRHPRRPRPSGRRKPRRSLRSGTCTRVSRWRRTRPTTGEGLTESTTGLLKRNRCFCYSAPSLWGLLSIQAVWY